MSNPFVQGGAEHEEGAGDAKEEADCANGQQRQQQQQNRQQLPEGAEDPKEENPQDTGSENKGKT